MKAPFVLALIIGVIAVSLFVVAKPQPQNQASSPLTDPREKHLKNIKQLTNEGENAEAYFSPDGKKLIFQRTAKRDGCDQIFSMNIDGTDLKMLSNGEGKTTCSYFTPDKKHIVYASTFKASPVCPPPPDYSRGYVWSLFAGFDIFVADLDGKNPKPLTTSARYDAEATIRKDGTIVFTSLRDGDLDIYTMDKNGKTVAVSGYDSRERPPSSDLIRQLKKVFVSGAKSGAYKATALVYDVRINLPGTGAKSDAIAVSLNHRDNYSVVVFFPYKFESAKLVVGDPIANQGEADIFRR